MKAAFIRGLPGSGKTTYADKIINARSAEGRHTFHYESDMFFTSDSGVYTFNASLLLQAHNWWFDKFCEALSIGSPSDMVIISNTFIRRKDIQPYLNKCAETPNTEFRILRINTQYQSVHDVPESTMEKMRRRYVSIDGECIINDSELIWK